MRAQQIPFWQYRGGEIEPLHEGMIITNEPGVYLKVLMVYVWKMSYFQKRYLKIWDNLCILKQ